MGWKLNLSLIYLAAVNVTAFALMGIDKKRAQRHEWRIRERTLFLTAALGGGFGATVGMHFFRHKTKHWYFVMGMPLLTIINIICASLIAERLSIMLL